jgi:hypothetical protein
VERIHPRRGKKFSKQWKTLTLFPRRGKNPPTAWEKVFQAVENSTHIVVARGLGCAPMPTFPRRGQINPTAWEKIFHVVENYGPFFHDVEKSFHDVENTRHFFQAMEKTCAIFPRHGKVKCSRLGLLLQRRQLRRCGCYSPVLTRPPRLSPRQRYNPAAQKNRRPRCVKIVKKR